MSKFKKQKAFTLVELIVVIVILAILATIAFLSYSSYSSQTRDSARLSDLSNLSKSIELFRTKAGTYPAPPNAVFNVTYSGAMVWYQGTIGDDFVRKLGASAGISKKPVDPLTGKEYVYSILANGSAYQIKADFEADSMASDSIIPFNESVYASAGNPKLSYIRGNYGGVIAKAQTGYVIYLLAVPSIISSTGSAGQTIEISSNSLSGYLLLNSQSNTTGIQYNPNKVVFTGTGIPSTDTNSGITNIMIALKNAYSGTTVQTINPTVSQMISTPDAQLSATIGAGLFLSVGSSVFSSSISTTSTGTVSINGVCGAANKNYVYNIFSYGIDSFCIAGTQNPVSITFPAQGSSVSWSCVGTNSGTTANCSASRDAAPINGSCGSANGTILTSAPTTNLCATGTASAVTGTGPWNWSCAGSNSGSTVNCSAIKSGLSADGASCNLASECQGGYCTGNICYSGAPVDGKCTIYGRSNFGCNPGIPEEDNFGGYCNGLNGGNYDTCY